MDTRDPGAIDGSELAAFTMATALTPVAGAGTIENALGLEIAPPPFATATAASPGVAMSDAGSNAVNNVDELYVVAKGAPFQYTVALGRNPLPCTDSSNSGPPASADLGSRFVIVTVKTAKDTGSAGVACGFATVIVTVVGAANNVALTWAVSRDGFT